MQLASGIKRSKIHPPSGSLNQAPSPAFLNQSNSTITNSTITNPTNLNELNQCSLPTFLTLEAPVRQTYIQNRCTPTVRTRGLLNNYELQFMNKMIKIRMPFKYL